MRLGLGQDVIGDEVVALFALGNFQPHFLKSAGNLWCGANDDGVNLSACKELPLQAVHEPLQPLLGVGRRVDVLRAGVVSVGMTDAAEDEVAPSFFDILLDGEGDMVVPKVCEELSVTQIASGLLCMMIQYASSGGATHIVAPP